MQCIGLYNPVKKDIYIYIFNCQYENISVKVIVRTNPAVCLTLLKEATVQNTASQRNIGVNQRLGEQHQVDFAGEHGRAAPCATRTDCMPSPS